jgi:regulator of nonsense transcripts 2
MTDDQSDINEEEEEKYNLFRIRLVCTLLDTCGSYFTKGTHKERLDRFLVHFQRYILRKHFWSSDVKFMIDDTFENLRPKLKRAKTLEDAYKAVEDQEKKPSKSSWGPKSYSIKTTNVNNDDESNNVNTSHSSEHSDFDSSFIKSGEEETVLKNEVGGDNYIKPKSSEYIPCNEDDEFVKQLDQFLNDSRESSQLDNVQLNRGGLTNLAIPMNLYGKETTPERENKEANVIPFKVLLKKGNKKQPTFSDINIPKDVKLASVHLKTRSQQKKQQQEMKRLVLKYDERDRQQSSVEERKFKDEDITFGIRPYASTQRGQKNLYKRHDGRGYPSYDENFNQQDWHPRGNGRGRGRGKDKQ